MVVSLREARPADHDAIVDVTLAAYQEYAAQIRSGSRTPEHPRDARQPQPRRPARRRARPGRRRRGPALPRQSSRHRRRARPGPMARSPTTGRRALRTRPRRRARSHAGMHPPRASVRRRRPDAPHHLRHALRPPPLHPNGLPPRPRSRLQAHPHPHHQRLPPPPQPPIERFRLNRGGAGRAGARAPRARPHGEPSSPLLVPGSASEPPTIQLAAEAQPPLGDGGPSEPRPERATATGEPCGRARGARARRPSATTVRDESLSEELEEIGGEIVELAAAVLAAERGSGCACAARRRPSRRAAT